MDINANVCNVCDKELLPYDSNGVYCPVCKSVYTKDLPTDEALNEFYEQFNETYHGGGRYKDAEKRQLLYAEKYLKIVEAFATGKSLIDIGSSTNPFPNLAKNKGYEVTVVDYVKPHNLDSDIEFIQSSIEKISIHKEFDVVTAFAILEHTKNPFTGIEQLIKLCKKNGIIIIYIPEIGEFEDNYSLGTSNWFCPPMHLNLLSRKALINYLVKNDCVLLREGRFELNFIRYSVRYGIGVLEGLSGYIFKLLFGENKWLKIRMNRKSKYQGMRYFVFKNH